ncbi:YfiR family protein [Caulobacter hibisci]|uniref:YfiR family protein n=1 Tax=Caulobacter hibisci TaxID=2035993 RepID=A0ABS0T3T7_9CAUL|nr:YfiR family protein [Caulobacter hibisci]MBI1686436.1 YfiR family protein [Caulobacter hibisci]
MSLVVPLFAAAVAVAPPAMTADDAAFKAAIVYNIGRFATFPPGRRQDDGDLVVCIEDDDPLAPALDRLEGKPSGAGKLVVRRSGWPFAAGCNLAFVSSRHATPAALEALADQGALTIGESKDFADQGAVRLITIGRQTRFEINNGVARRAGATLSAQLLRLAVKVR